MKKITYLFALFIIVFSLNSCKRSLDETGDGLNDFDPTHGGISGPRVLSRELINDSLVAHYLYNGTKLINVLGSDYSNTQITHNGSLVYKIDYNGKEGSDSAVVSQFFNYDTSGKIIEIAESKKIVSLAVPAVADVKSKSIYSFTYNGASKITEILKKSGDEVIGAPFTFTEYEKNTLTISSINNLTDLKLDYGNITGGVLSPSLAQIDFSFQNYDANIAPYTTLPLAYNLHYLLRNQIYGFHISPNNPKKIVVSSALLPNPVTLETLYTYDPQTYATSGFGYNFVYKPL